MTQEIRALTGMRGLAAWGVFCVHTLGPHSRAARIGTAGVSVFFVLSGFILTLATQKCALQSIACRKAFWWKRFARVFPAHEVALLVALPDLTCLFASCGALQVSSMLLQALLTIFLVQEWIPDTLDGWNPPAWSLSNEVFFYLCFPLIVQYTRCTRFHPFGVLLLVTSIGCMLPTLLLYAISKTDFHDDGSYAFMITRRCVLVRGFDFLLGMLTGELFLSRTPLPRWLCCVVAPLAAIPIQLAVIYWDEAEFLVSGGLLAPWFALVIFGLAEWETAPLSRLLSTSLWHSFGVISYAVYLFHYSFPIYFSEAVNADYWFFWLSATVAAAVCLHHFIEKPCNRWLLSRSPYRCTCTLPHFRDDQITDAQPSA